MFGKFNTLNLGDQRYSDPFPYGECYQVKWSECLPSTPIRRVRIPLKQKYERKRSQEWPIFKLVMFNTNKCSF